MDEAKRYEIAVLAEDLHVKRERLRMLAMANIAHLDYEGRLKATIEYELAIAEVVECETALRRARSR